MELTIQMIMIFCGSQFFSQLIEYYLPLLWKGLEICNFSFQVGFKKSPIRYEHDEVQSDVFCVLWGAEIHKIHNVRKIAAHGPASPGDSSFSF